MNKAIKKIIFPALASIISLVQATPVSAHQAPAACTTNDFVVNLGQSNTVVYDETSPFGATTIVYTVTTGNPNTSGSGCHITDVNVNVTTPDGVVHNLQTAGNYAIGTATAVLGTVNYDADSSDKTGPLLVASVNAQGDLHDNPLGEDPQNITKQVSALVINPNTIASISSSATQVLAGGTVDLTVTEQNNGDVDLIGAYVEVDNGVGTLDATHPSLTGDDGDGLLEVGETWSWTVSGVVINSDTTFTATGHGTDPVGNDVTVTTGFSTEEDSVLVGVANPTTVTTISASSTLVVVGSNVTLTVTEENDGDTDLTDAYVAVDNGVGTLDASHPNLTGDDGDGILEPGETWQWMVDVVINAMTTFTATGHGIDPFGNDITYPDDPEEQDSITIEIETLTCTLTQGYWKTHSDQGPAPYDSEGWGGLGDYDGDGTSEEEGEAFHLSSMTWLEVFNAAPKGNAYFSLAHQYMAAVLNAGTGASVPTEVQDAMDDAFDLFAAYSPEDIAALKGNNPIRQQFIELASVLGSYNEGVIGPGHCGDEI